MYKSRLANDSFLLETIRIQTHVLYFNLRREKKKKRSKMKNAQSRQYYQHRHREMNSLLVNRRSFALPSVFYERKSKIIFSKYNKLINMKKMLESRRECWRNLNNFTCVIFCLRVSTEFTKIKKLHSDWSSDLRNPGSFMRERHIKKKS